MDDVNKQLDKLNKFNDLGIEITFNEQESQAINEKYSRNLELAIDGWTDENILKMRKDMEQFILKEGKTRKEIQDYFEKNYEVDASEAVYLARQETSMLLSTYSQNKYIQSGLKYFKWSTSMDMRVRPSHEALQGHVFAFDDPPIIDGRPIDFPQKPTSCFEFLRRFVAALRT